ncbi:mechanosensitive ion channel protein 1, mitochondrial-like [Prosopis cineraria]|uniref:mechanosensitive ion channel protein 1, mitochondrial-like n=1 Tax=Prosopis cineraria TaxID=364024 RepID=UPI0024107D96|nr:mechanosensitive ion channel protein 1, mitochondrial-like [Prosopis cineraria]XP_054782425.1 mechanosensitive ion channel protein 1, mitochondrial-like [Prosopis cineraria]
MAGVTFSCLKRLKKLSAKCSLNSELIQPHHRMMNLTRREDCVHVSFPGISLSQAYSKGELQLHDIFAKNQFRTMISENSNLLSTKPSASFSPKFSSFWLHHALPFSSMTLLLNHRSYSSSLSGKLSRDGTTDFAPDSIDASDWTDELTPFLQQLLDSNPYLNDVVIPLGGTLTATLIAWTVMPLILRKFHENALQSSAATFLRSKYGEQVPYEKSLWGALEDPLRYLVTFVAFSQICVMVAPTSEAPQQLAEAWREAVMLLFTWFLHRWKTNILGHMSSSQSLLGHGQHKLLTLDKVSSAGVFGIGTMALAEACGVSVQSIATAGCIGGLATAIAARDVLGNAFSGLCMQFTEPFTIGDTIKAGSVEGEVIEMGVTSTSLVNAEKLTVVVPNSFFCSEVVVIKSRVEWHSMISKIPVRVEAINRISRIKDDIKSMLATNPKVLSGKGSPYCYLSRIETSYAELTLGYNLKHMGKDEMRGAEQDIVGLAVEITKRHAAELGLLTSSSSDSD